MGDTQCSFVSSHCELWRVDDLPCKVIVAHGL